MDTNQCMRAGAYYLGVTKIRSMTSARDCTKGEAKPVLLDRFGTGNGSL